ncbi:MAG: hypothetical protein KA763_02410, partial [Xanthomonadales bacterium]|nr:hypothetical protein [Xanthomonadales bacterium]
MNPHASLHWLRQQLEPLNLAAHITWIAIAVDLARQDFGVARTGVPAIGSLLLLGLFVVGLIANFSGRLRGVASTVALMVQGLSALALIASTRVWSTPILCVVVVAQAASLWPLRGLVLWMLASNVLLYGIIARFGWDSDALLGIIMQIGFQAFAALMARIAAGAEQRAAELRAINAELI